MPEQTMKQQVRIVRFTHSAMAVWFFSLMLSITVFRLYAEENMPLTLSSSAFREGGEIPSKYTCEGQDIAPPLQWEGVDKRARTLVLIVDDPDAPDPKDPKMTYVHWVLYNIPSDTSGLPSATSSGDLPSGTEEGINDWKRTGYGGPCPPIGRHRYFFKLYALNTTLLIKENPTKAEVEAAMRGHIIEQCELIGTYKKRM